jgi:hypothetical protein
MMPGYSIKTHTCIHSLITIFRQKSRNVSWMISSCPVNKHSCIHIYISIYLHIYLHSLLLTHFDTGAVMCARSCLTIGQKLNDVYVVKSGMIQTHIYEHIHAHIYVGIYIYIYIYIHTYV